MHYLEGEYKDENNGYSCSVYLQGGEPVLLLNLERYFSNKNKISGSHCDLLYLVYKANTEKWFVFLIELKDIQKQNFFEAKKESKRFREGIIKKFQNTAREFNSAISSFLNLNRKDTHIIALLIVPSKIKSLVKRSVILNMNKKKNSEIDEWKISSCNDRNNLWSG